MSNLLRFRDPRKARAEAAEWLVLLEEGLSTEQRARLAVWLEEDAAHGDALVRLARVWDSFDLLTELADVFPLERYGARRRPRGVPLRAAAAVAAVAVGAVVAVQLAIREPADASSAAASAAPPGVQTTAASLPGAGDAAETYATPVGAQFTADLADGSSVTLNTDTRLEVTYSASERLVVLEKGEAIFRVARDAARPFRVRAGDREVQAVGTVFNVELTSRGDLEVTVTEGRVRVARRALDPEPAAVPGPELMLDAGELAVIGEREQQVVPLEPAQIEASLAWQNGTLIYRGETLEAVLEDMSRYTTVRFTIADDALRDRRVGGYFRAGDVDALLLALRASFGIEERRDGDTIILTSGR